ncbi:hypothetical protein MARINOS108_10795 [Marinoscillum sp. 108]|nr:hypothetical protein MARINOS108_10795 [Marinoscillum sp. 108]
MPPTFTSKIFWVGCSTHPPGDLRLENGEVFRSIVVLDVLPGVGSSSDEQLSSVKPKLARTVTKLAFFINALLSISKYSELET